ncbi:Predicted dehydrogenase [Actinopolymorpha cephalotaxi]|uniref:Dehydrogenase n=1 Tax=Actinopolymorpha cephalotaxi TaxID=504797 RepID=A0A1I2R2C1_9ACTN|nr:Gfo/Idh/MocA family oxidoreductase [Actinopolymorpha cephalotaxi]NYH82400.1 putative dehydrogenase [Actinopolymorpha cephalotaxi]SFG34143.1 Predicted dehydrogenase [Actinopolymorpha cephalotaxi]
MTTTPPSTSPGTSPGTSPAGHRPVPRVGLVGVNGYGRTHLRNAVRLQEQGLLRLTGYADVAPDAATVVAEHLPARGYAGPPPRGHRTLTDLLAAGRPDIVVLGTPIPLHAQMIEEAFAAGASVLVEKPPVVTVQDIDRLLARQGSGDATDSADPGDSGDPQDSAGPLCQVGFQNARAPVVRALARLARDGALGEVEHVGLVGRWSRADSYYARTDWAGRLVHHGRYVLDGTLTNPFAHGLMNALIVAGDHDDAPATPTTVRAELYRCRDSIDGDDTASVRIDTAEGRTVVAAVTLCAPAQVPPYVFVKGSRATARAYYTTGELTLDSARTVRPPAAAVRAVEALAADTARAGRAPGDAGSPDLLANLVNVVRGYEDRLLCPLRMTRGFVLALNGMYESAGRPGPVSPRCTTVHDENGERWVHLVGVDDLIERCARDGLLFSEAGAGWASPTRAFSLANYRDFTSFSC